ncbi:DUF1351 domain-containing protein [Lactobacillus crispatus]|uniref:DUF1351 domain-containing protein n=1 Tax=Lactobacillus crispatus TaxID=47770 RepID=A0A2N5KYS5_9LACO|nr:DUF1351 domain-containing protein [Lactobacillus crispatus]PLT11384.1 DUF1351 domain-containing protein [Lactobacillus crispatus]
MTNNELIQFDGIEYPVSYKPAEIIFPKYGEMKDNILKVHDEFADWTVTPQNLKSSKEVRKNLNELKRTINSQRISITSGIQKPAKMFKANIDDLIAIIDETTKNIDSQLKQYDDKLRQDKHDQHVKFIKQACEDAGVDPSKIRYNASWDNKTYSNPKFEAELYEQVDILRKNKQQLETNKRIIIQKADELGIPFAHYFEQLQREIPLDEILNDMQAEKDELIAIAKKQKETKQKEQADLVKHGDKAIDPQTGEIKEKTYTFRLEFQNVTKYQVDQLNNFLKDWGIKARRIK